MFFLFRFLRRYRDELVSSEGAWWILLMDALLLIPLLFAAFFFPVIALIGLGVVALLLLGAWVVYATQGDRGSHRFHLWHKQP